MLWPDFGPVALDEAIEWYRARERRFGRTSEQLQAERESDVVSEDRAASPFMQSGIDA